MKKKTIIILVVSLVCVVAVCLTALLWNRPHKINPFKIEAMYLPNDAEVSPFTDADARKFTKLFNSAEYVGEANGEGGTPDYGVFIVNRDGSYISITEFGGGKADFEVSVCDKNYEKQEWYYITSEELKEFLSEIYKCGNN